MTRSGLFPRLVRPLLVVAVASLFFGAALAAGFAKSTLTIRTAGGDFPITVEMAMTDKERARGLMWRRDLAPDAGMLFDFKRPRSVAMWMKNTYIPLDMLFIAGDGRIINIARRTEPHSLTPIAAARPARAVLELAAGTATRLGIRPGDRIIHPIFADVK